MPGEDKQIQDQEQVQSGITSNTFNTSQSQNQNATQRGSTGPWGQAMPLLQSLLAKYSAVPTDVTGAQQTAANTLLAGAAGVPNAGNAAWDAAQRMFGTSTAPQIGMLTDALAKYQGNIGNTASGAELDPNLTPGFSTALGRSMDDITNRVKAVYAGSGRDPSGAGSFAGGLTRALAEGTAPAIAAQYNQNKANQMTAAERLFGAGQGTAGQITQQGQVPLANAAQAIGLLPGVQAAFTAPGTAQLSAANVMQNLPLANLAGLLSPALGLAGLGQDTTNQTVGTSGTTSAGTGSGTSLNIGRGHSETVQPQSVFSNILGGINAAAGLYSLLSDERMKEDIEPIGKLADGQKVVRFRYKGDPTTHMGLLAQKVRAPGAVTEMGGLKFVNYKRATDRAAAMERAA